MCLSNESLPGNLVFLECLWQKLESYFASEAGILSQIDLTHSTLAKFFQNPVMGHRLANLVKPPIFTCYSSSRA